MSVILSCFSFIWKDRITSLCCCWIKTQGKEKQVRSFQNIKLHDYVIFHWFMVYVIVTWFIFHFSWFGIIVGLNLFLYGLVCIQLHLFIRFSPILSSFGYVFLILYYMISFLGILYLFLILCFASVHDVCSS